MSQHDIDLTLLRQWVGKTESHSDTINPGFAAALAATLDHPQTPAAGDALPPLWHWIYFWTACRQSEVGDDGHPRRGGFLPPVPLPRRMWAGGRLTFPEPLPIGAAISRTSSILDVKDKAGASGHLVFVTVRHEIRCSGRIAITEEHDIVYRDMPAPGSPQPAPKPAPAQAQWSREITPDPVLLFRYSALTFNGHRIHYDQAYARDEEGYPDLVVHGPLTATLLQQLALDQGEGRQLARFEFRGVSPLFVSRAFRIEGHMQEDGTLALWARGPGGELAMSATAVLR